MEQPAKCNRCGRSSRQTELLEALKNDAKIYLCPDCLIEMTRAKIYRIGLEEKRKSEIHGKYLP